MYDIHSHILPAMDDGARNLAESIRIAEETVKKGIKGIVATPHFMEEGYRFALPELEEKIRQFQEVLKKREIDLEIYPGAEVFIYPGLIRDLEEGLVPTINKSSYLLLEFPMYGFPPYTGDLLYNLQVLGYKVIIAHPERYREVVEDPDFLYRFARGSIYAQVNSSSLLGV
ncbi:MAG TPA: tyrosine protein phosphatase, partial [Halanaerobiales bacterium]|nr:tyrosine protein phosphatase [Halanaerobiales bacterium]HPZ63623.1 tyrosine protein phosphatase [Halanaerobiales bacterium]